MAPDFEEARRIRLMSVFSSDQPLDTGSQPLNQSPWTPMRQELRSWFRRNAESLAPAYEGAVELLGDTTFPGRIHFIAHAMRDIANILISALDPQDDRKRVDYFKHMQGIQEQWKLLDNQLFQTEETPPITDIVSIPLSLAKKIEMLVKEHQNGYETAKARSNRLFRILMRNDPTQATLNERTAVSFEHNRKWFVAIAHFPADLPNQVEERELQRHFEMFEKTLHSFVGSFFIGICEIDAILQQANQ